jgi:hypothetical protein
VALVRTDISEEQWFLQETQGVTSQQTAFFIVTTTQSDVKEGATIMGLSLGDSGHCIEKGNSCQVCSSGPGSFLK